MFTFILTISNLLVSILFFCCFFLVLIILVPIALANLILKCFVNKTKWFWAEFSAEGSISSELKSRTAFVLMHSVVLLTAVFSKAQSDFSLVSLICVTIFLYGETHASFIWASADTHTKHWAHCPPSSALLVSFAHMMWTHKKNNQVRPTFTQQSLGNHGLLLICCSTQNW